MWTPSRFAGLTVIAALLVGASSTSAKPTPQQKCQGGKNQAAGKYAACRQNAEAKLATTGDTVKYKTALGKCELTFRSTWLKLEAKAGATCLDLDGKPSADAFNGVIGSCTNNVATALKGNAFTPGGTLLETNQATCYDAADNTPKSCDGTTGQDGELRKGLARSYTDNGNGTITDNQTGLMWEKKSDDLSIHRKDDFYSWPDAFAVFIAALNTANFAGYGDWRLPNVNELHSILDYAGSSTLVDAVFNTACAPSCTAADCSCTVPDLYWSSTTYPVSVTAAWEVGFDLGYVTPDDKSNLGYVRAVRGGG